MRRTTTVTGHAPLIALLAAAIVAPLVASGGPAAADTPPWQTTGLSWQAPDLALATWTYGDSLSYRTDPRLTGGHVVVATSATPKVCTVATDGRGNPTGSLALVDVGTCTVSFHIDGDATHPPYDGTVTHTVAPRTATVSCQDLHRASDEPDPALTPTFANLAPWDDSGDFTVLTDPGIPSDRAPGRWPVAPVVLTSPTSPATGRSRYLVHTAGCTMTIDPVLEVVGVPTRKSAGLVVDGQPVTGNRYSFPYGTQVSYAVEPLLGGTAPVAGQQFNSPEAWFASSSVGTTGTDTTITYQTFGDLVSASPFDDLFKREFMSYFLKQYGWQAARGYLTAGYDGLDETTRVSRLRAITSDLVRLVQNTLILYLGNPRYDAAKASGNQLIADLQMVSDRGGFPEGR